MNTFTAAELVEFYQKVDDGGVIEVNWDEDGWHSVTTSGPTVGSYKGCWRINPAKKIIDISHFIESGIDCEFSDTGNSWCLADQENTTEFCTKVVTEK